MRCGNLIGFFPTWINGKNCQVPRHKAKPFAKFIFVSRCPRRENVLQQNEVDAPLESTKQVPGSLGFETG